MTDNIFDDQNSNNTPNINHDTTPCEAQQDQAPAYTQPVLNTDSATVTPQQPADHPEYEPMQAYPPYDDVPVEQSNNQNPYVSPQNTEYKNPYDQQYQFLFKSQPQSEYPYSAPGSGPVPIKPKKKSSALKTVLVILLCVVLSGAAGLGGAIAVNRYSSRYGSSSGDNSSGSLVINKITGDTSKSNALNEGDLTVAEITEKAANSVVEITTESVTTGSFMQQYISSGAGSGVIISDDGYIISNNHVISGATSITVTLRNGKSYKAKLIGTDATLDVSLIKIDATGLTAASFGDSSKLTVGDTAIAIGNPLGQLGGTVTSGIISALNRDIDIDGVTMNLMQTNAAINPGNSGGGLFNGSGLLVGLVCAKSSGNDVEGLGFAIPINDVEEILGDLKEYGYVRGRVYVGVSLIDISNTQTAMMYGLSELGLYVNFVDAGSTAYKAGFEAGDRITAVGGKAVSTSEEFDAIIDEHKVGDIIEVTVSRTSRSGQTTTGTLNLTLEEYNPTSSNTNNQTSQQDNSNSNSNSNSNGNDNFSYDDYFNDFFGGYN